MKSEYVVLGGAGFIGSHFVGTLLDRNKTVLVIDDYSAKFFNLLDQYVNNSNLSVCTLDIRNTEQLIDLIHPDSTIIHLASNPDIAAAATNPRVDFVNGTVLTESVAEAARIAGVKKLLYASGSGVYGEMADKPFQESDQMIPISPYGASKLAGESLLSAYAHMFGIEVTAFRFANVVGPNQTHGVGYDFVRRLKANPKELLILGDGNQRKPYIYVSDVVNAVLESRNTSGKLFDTYNISTSEQVSVNEIADIAIEKLGLSRKEIAIQYTGGTRGWSGDVPKVMLNSDKMRKSGWKPEYSSRDAIVKSVSEMVDRLN
jgi:UDP-glucose 4-epimerase